MNHKDSSIRKQWLFMWCVTTLIGLIAPMLQLLSNHLIAVPVMIRVVTAVVTQLVTAILAIASFRCIYRKPGIKFLTFLIILNLISMIYTYASFLLGKLPLPLPHFYVYFFIAQAINVLWVIACFRMRKLNKRLQREPDYKSF